MYTFPCNHVQGHVAVSVLDLNNITFGVKPQISPYSDRPVILMLFLSERCKSHPSQDDHTHQAMHMMIMRSTYLVEPIGIEPMTS